MIQILYPQKQSNYLDIQVKNPKQFHNYDTLECHIILYPYSRNINSEHILFNPFEEYVKDVHSGAHSAYSIIEASFSKYFGIFLGFLISLVFYIFKPDDLFSVESVVSIFVAYTIGKEIWSDLERALYALTKSWKFRYQEDYYKYKLEKTTTLTTYSHLAKLTRYGKKSPLPEKMHFLQLSNSQTVRLFFEMKSLRQIEEEIHLLSVIIDKKVVKEFWSSGYLLGIKLSLSKKKFFMTKSYEFFQSIHLDEFGCLNEKEEWIKDATLSKV
ncbi:MAG: hypothetical protein N3A69_16595, partial [Leptospiraceae bacterium]|nr:hypothetical protein [Leptospiraceae bacterium]